jgi:MYXO-CTERM domain-containing protein
LPRPLLGIATFAAMLCASSNVRADILAEWNPPNSDLQENSFPATTLGNGINATAMTFSGNGLGPIVITGSYAIKGWPVTQDLTKYIEFSVVGSITFASVDFTWWSNPNYPPSVELRSNADNYAQALASAIHPRDSLDHNFSLDVSSLGTRVGVTTFRMYFYGSNFVTPTSYFQGPFAPIGNPNSFGMRVIGVRSLCPLDQRVSGRACVACAPGTIRPAGDDPSGADTTCTAIECDVNQSVSSNACVACAPGSTRPAGDSAAAGNTTCAPTLCADIQRVSNHACIACAPGSTRPAGDDATGADTECNATLCAPNQRVSKNACVACAPGTTRAAGDNATGADTDCNAGPSAGDGGSSGGTSDDPASASSGDTGGCATSGSGGSLGVLPLLGLLLIRRRRTRRASARL